MLRIHAVGRFRVEVDGRDRTSLTPDRATSLLAWLALNPGSHRRSAVAARFWPDVLDDSARASLRSALWSLRRRLGEDANGALVATRDHVGLSDEVWVDIVEAERLRADGRLEEAIALGDGELIPASRTSGPTRPATSTANGRRPCSRSSRSAPKARAMQRGRSSSRAGQPRSSRCRRRRTAR
jgi:hypothetical protein